jgi:hypothetical protein
VKWPANVTLSRRIDVPALDVILFFAARGLVPGLH